MTVFDQRSQHVTYQYNVAGDLNIGAVQNKLEVIEQLEKIEAEMGRAIQASVFDEETATDAGYQIKKAVQQAKKPEPDKKKVLDYLKEAKSLIENVAAATGLVSALTKAAEVVQKFF
jgi:hypothetical protein